MIIPGRDIVVGLVWLCQSPDQQIQGLFLCEAKFGVRR